MKTSKKIEATEDAGVPEAEATSALALGLRLFALALAASSAALLPHGRVDVPLVVAGIGVAVALALVQHAAAGRAWPGRGRWLIVPHVLVWTLLVHATGGQRSPLAVGYLLELPLTGALYSRSGIALAGLATAAAYFLYGWRIAGQAFEPVTYAIVMGFVAVCAAISWRVVGVLERQRARIAASRRALARRADTLCEALQLLGDSLGGALMSIDEMGRVAGLNPSGGALLRVDPASMLGQPWQAALSLDPESASQLIASLDSGEPRRRIAMLVALPTARSIAVRAEMWPCPSAAGRLTYLLLEPEREPAQDDPIRRLGQGAACVAHQIKNSVHALQGLVTSLDREAPSARDGAVTTEEYLAALQSLGGLASDVLAAAGASRAASEPVVIQDALRLARLLLGPVAVRLGLPPEPLRVQASRGPLIHALFNLMDNAAQANPPGQPVEVRAERNEARVWVEIADVGPGLPSGISVTSGPVPSARGSGWGLVAARRFVEDCGGRLVLMSSERGTCWRVDLPASLGAVAG